MKSNLKIFREKELKLHSKNGLIGINLGKNKETQDGSVDYVVGIRELCQYADYIVVNISSPNTVGLRLLQEKKELNNLLIKVQIELFSTVNSPKYISKSNNMNFDTEDINEKFSPPLLIKISPDMSEIQMKEVAEICMKLKVDGIIISNTTINERDVLLERGLADEAGELKG